MREEEPRSKEKGREGGRRGGAEMIPSERGRQRDESG